MPHPHRPVALEKFWLKHYYSKGDRRHPSIPSPPFRGFPAGCDPSSVCPDWVWSLNSNVHICNDLAWFVDYVPWRTYVEQHYPVMSSDPLYHPVLGMGTVELPVQRAPLRGGPGSEGTFRLHHVLYIPTFAFNVMGGPRTDDYGPLNYQTVRFGIHCGTVAPGEIVSPESIDNKLAYFDSRDDVVPGLMTLHLSGAPIVPKLAKSRLREYFAGPGKAMFPLVFRWHQEEFERWYDRMLVDNAEEWNQPGPPLGAFNPEEVLWLEERFGGETDMMARYGLDPADKEQRIEGQGIARVLMRIEFAELLARKSQEAWERGPGQSWEGCWIPPPSKTTAFHWRDRPVPARFFLLDYIDIEALLEDDEDGSHKEQGKKTLWAGHPAGIQGRTWQMGFRGFQAVVVGAWRYFKGLLGGLGFNLFEVVRRYLVGSRGG
ncbi:hypothetical protein QBC39DRAFT_308985 [Podospora conica]|nr:hypothetical protein QBC39DRAFT_308985 [Schizothecium conicum]